MLRRGIFFVFSQVKQSTNRAALPQPMKIGHNILIYLAVFSLLLLGNRSAQAQSDLLFYHTDQYYNAPNYNPAFLTQQKNFTLNLFPMAGLSLTYNNDETVNQLISSANDEITDEEGKDIFRSLVRKDLSYDFFEATFLNIGFNNHLGSFAFQIKERGFANMRLGGEFAEFIADTTGNLAVGLDSRQQVPFQGVHLREYNFAYAKELVPQRLSMGLRAKLYFGKSMANSNLNGGPSARNGNFYAETAGSIFFSIPATHTESNGEIDSVLVMNDKSVADYLMNTRNTGFGLDLGLNWQVNPYLQFSAAILDLGSITWKESVYELNFDEGNYELDDVYYNEETDQLEKASGELGLIDDVESLYEIRNDQTSYKTQMPLRVNIGLNYAYSPELSIGFVNQLYYLDKLVHNNFQATANIRQSEKLTLVTGIGVYDGSFKNIPLGFQYKWKAAQIYLGTDNILAPILPDFSDYTSFTFGIDLNLFGPKQRYDNLDYLPFYDRKKKIRKKRNGTLFQGI